MAKNEIIEVDDNAKAKARYWVAVGYPENMRPDWEDTISEVLELPYCYCVHDKDKLEVTKEEEDRKVHVHIIIAFTNTTTGRHALEIFRRLNAPGKNAFPTAFPVASIRHKYDYLIHRTEKAQRQGKYQYEPSERKTGNNFDIGSYEQISLEDKKKMRRELGRLICERGFTTYLDLYEYVISNMDAEFEDVLCSWSGHFERLTKGNFHRRQCERIEQVREDLNAMDQEPDSVKNYKACQELHKQFRHVHVDGTRVLVCNDECSKCKKRDCEMREE